MGSISRYYIHVQETQQSVQDLIPIPSIYIYMCTLYACTNTCLPRFSPSGFFGLLRCLVPTPGLTCKYPTCSVCVCERIHTHAHIHTLLPSSKKRENTDRALFFFISKIMSHDPPTRALVTNANEQSVQTRAYVHSLWKVCLQTGKLMPKTPV